MITIFQFPRLWGLPNISPFCLKLETYLRLTKLPYQIVSTRNLKRTPRGKLPYIQDGDVQLSDTGLIIHYLKKAYGDPLDANLTPLQVAQGVAIQRLVEEHLYWTLVYSRWVDPDAVKVLKETIFAEVPALIRGTVVNLVRKKTAKQVYQQGIGRYSKEEVYALGINDLQALVDLMPATHFLFGDRPSTYDVIVFAFVANILFAPINSPLKAFVNLHPELAAYCERMMELAYPATSLGEKDFYYQGA